MKHRRLRAFVLFLALALALTVAASADFGPKARVTVTVEHPPEGAYYLDLLTQKPGDFDNLDWNELEELDRDRVAALRSLEGEGWYPALVGGTAAPMWGDLTGTPEGDTMVHQFHYVGVPTTFRVILAAEDGTVTVSEPYTRRVLQVNVTIDGATGKLTAPNLAAACAGQYLSTCLMTLVIEGLLLLAFGFSLRKNWKVFLATNVVTQIALTVALAPDIVGGSLVTGLSAALMQGDLEHLLGILLMLVLSEGWIELLILAAEALVYVRWLKGHGKGRRIGYAVTANLTSWLISLILAGWQYQWLMGG